MDKNTKLPTNKNFGIVFSVIFLIISLFPLINDGSLRIWSLIVSTVFLFLGLINSKILTPLNKIWFKFGLLLGRIVSPVIIGVIFFLVVTPTALIMRLIGKDLLNLKFNKHQSYWIEKTGPKSKMKNQF
jgi:hypothetical protein